MLNRFLFNFLLCLSITSLSFSHNLTQADENKDVAQKEVVKKTVETKPEVKKTSYYLIGNSLTWDTIPSHLDGDVQWHVDCGKSLPYIFAHPEKPCIKKSYLWTKALKEKQYDFVSVQPHYGSTLKKDIETISTWMEMQPKAVFIIHTGWARQITRAEEYSSKKINGPMIHSRFYYAKLISELEKRYPQRKFRTTGAIDMLDRIAKDIENKKAPFKNMGELHRDAVHMKTETGRYLMHNLMRITLGQPISDKHFEKTTEEHKKYFNKLLKARK
ncbi:hypothetical protein MNBD_PLANCTO02-1244 [hydrothermal vent metagenome]|uniref:Uncharacterized protein n=1 Tax=hydrothermal vent metagenome TaxID=652676 RepID=A0A3B1E825_9ZZZZ